MLLTLDLLAVLSWSCMETEWWGQGRGVSAGCAVLKGEPGLVRHDCERAISVLGI